MSLPGATLRIDGEVRAAGTLEVEGRVRGPVTCEGGVVTVTATSQIEGDILAADVTIFGRVSGQIIATETVDVRPGAVVSGVVIAPKFILHDGASFNGRVDPRRLDAAVSVARFQQRQRTQQAG